MHAASVMLLSWALIGAACCVSWAGTGLATAVILAVLVAFVGLPHGAADHVFARPRLEPILGRVWLPVFLAGYVIVATIVLLGWFYAAPVTIVTFFLASAWHFGQEEPRLPIGPPGWRSLFRFARGGLVIWTPLAVQNHQVARVLAVAAPGGLDSGMAGLAGPLAALGWCMLVIAAIGWCLEVRMALGRRGRTRRVLLADSALVASLVALFAIASPIIGFLLYFCGWHSVRGLRRLRRELGQSWPRLATRLAPMTLGAIALTALATQRLLRTAVWDDTLIRATFVCLSAVAVPHLLLHGVGPFLDRFESRHPAESFRLGSPA